MQAKLIFHWPCFIQLQKKAKEAAPKAEKTEKVLESSLKLPAFVFPLWMLPVCGAVMFVVGVDASCKNVGPVWNRHSEVDGIFYVNLILLCYILYAVLRLTWKNLNSSQYSWLEDDWECFEIDAIAGGGDCCLFVILRCIGSESKCWTNMRNTSPSSISQLHLQFLAWLIPCWVVAFVPRSRCALRLPPSDIWYGWILVCCGNCQVGLKWYKKFTIGYIAQYVFHSMFVPWYLV